MERVLLFLILLSTVYLLIKQFSGIRERTDDSYDLDIRDLALKVKTQLSELDSIRETRNEMADFKVQSFDLEVNFTIKRNRSTDGKLEYKLLTLDDKEEYAKEQVQKITIHLNANPGGHGRTPAQNSGE